MRMSDGMNKATTYLLKYNVEVQQLKTFLYSQAYRHWQSSSSVPEIQFNHILICFHWHMARHQLCIIIIIIIINVIIYSATCV